MNTDDMIRANLERITRERSGDRSLLGFPVIERDALEDELDALRLERKIANDARRAALSPEAREVEDLKLDLFCLEWGIS